MSKKRKKAYSKARPVNTGYGDAGASFVKRALKGFTAQSGSAIEDIDFHNRPLRERSRMLYMSTPLATSAIKTNRTKAIGVGLQLECTIDRDLLRMSEEEAKRWQKRTEKEFSIWATKKQNCDATGTNTFAGLQQLVFSSWLLSGDVFTLIKRYEPTQLNPYSLRLHVIEADRICTPTQDINVFETEGVVSEGDGKGNKIHDGVEVDKNGCVVAYHICSEYPRSRYFFNGDISWTRVPAYGSQTGLPNILHLMNAERPEQYRGVPYLAQVIEPLLQMRRYDDAQIMAAIIQSFFCAWIETETDKSEIPLNEVGSGDFDGIPSENPGDEVSQSENEYEMGPGTVSHLAPGEKIVFGQPQIPSAGFDAFVKTFAKLVGSALEIPAEILLKEFNASYSASRAALLEMWEAASMKRSWFVNDFCQPVYELWLAEAVALGRIKAPGFFTDPLLHDAWCSCKWIGPAQSSINPLVEVNAAEKMVANGFKTREQVTREMGGGDWSANIGVIKAENEQLKEALDVLAETEGQNAIIKK